MDFRLTDEQTLLVDTARSLFTRECPTDASSAGWPTSRRWRPICSTGTSASGWSWRRAPRSTSASSSSRRARSSPRDPSCPPPAASPRCSGRRATRWPTTPWPARSPAPSRWPAGPDGRLRATDLELVDKVALVIDGSRLAVVDASAVEARPVKTLDLARSMSFVTVPEGLDLEPLEEAALDRRLRAGRAGRRGGAGRGGPVAGRGDGGLRQGTGAVRGAHRLVPGRAAPAGRLRARLRGGGRGRRRTRRCASTPTTPTGPGRCTSPRPGPARPPGGAAKDAMQLHGGIGYTCEHDLHLRLRRAYADDALFGTGAWHLDQLADLLFA